MPEHHPDPEALAKLRRKLDAAEKAERFYGRPAKSVEIIDENRTIVTLARPAKQRATFPMAP